MTDATLDLAARIAAALDAPIVEHNAEEIPTEGYVVERVEESAHILYDEATVGLADVDPLTFALTLEARWQGTTIYDEGEAALMVMKELREPWDARGWVVDHGCEPDNGWDEEERCFVLNMVKDCDNIEALVEEVKFAVEEGTVAWIEDVPEDDDAAEDAAAEDAAAEDAAAG